MKRFVNLDFEVQSTVSAVLFNGRKLDLNRVKIADVTTGELTYYVTDDKGRYRINTATRDTLTKTVKGTVEIQLKVK
ncbi:hypothetical protein PQD74_gp092 [Stenotrophomonas phage Siara]|uniref:Uncharacterized protein n=1 Tax=Stenotrophomonas phage Siara TaxID=2859658 RepID=A0AAE7WMI8_9CAUD|nr:hypothetical protein PQD74_gp092 [Stenotrophomonas phage Siara]QYW02072.1 hypothetical protein CPT_Siara_071 [Stenotrophomonas phage Siara]